MSHSWQGHCAALAAWPWRTTCLQSTTGELLKSYQIWSIHRVRVYQGIVSNRDQEDDQLTNQCVCRAPCAQEHHSLKTGNLSKNRDAMGDQDFTQ